jgi:large subunit ribosomal protein L20
MRVTIGAARRRKKKRIFKEAKGNVGGRSKLLRTVKETVIRSRAYAYRDRRVRKRDFRRLWITRISAACMANGARYSTFIHGLTIAGVELNRKMLSELAISNPAIFTEIVGIARDAVAQKAAA